MDRRRMDVAGCRVVQREGRGRKLAVVVAVQNVLVAACLLVTLYVFWHVQEPRPDNPSPAHIYFFGMADMTDNETVKFQSTEKVSLMVPNEEDGTIHINCTGPYILYIDACYRSINNVSQSNATLQLKVAGQDSPLSSFALRTSSDVCRGLHSIVYLRVNDVASLHLYSNNGFKMKNVTVGLHSLLGNDCTF